MTALCAGTTLACLLVGLNGEAQAAVAYVGVAGARTATTGATSLALPAPAAVASGQIEIAIISRQGASTITPPSGWNQIIDTTVGPSLRQTAFWHVAGAGEATTTWTFSANSIAVGGIVAYSGVDTTSIVDAAGQQTGTSGTTATVPSLSAAYPGDLILGVGSFNNPGTLTAASGSTARGALSVATTNGPALLAEDLTQGAAGATATQAITDSAAATAWIGQAIALKPVSAAGVLSATTSASPTFSANVNGGDQTPTYMVPVTVRASVSPPPGWKETVTSTQFTSGSHTLAATASKLTAAPAVACDTTQANCVAPTNLVGYPVTVPAGATAPAAVKYFNAATGTGAGQFTVTPTITVSVPQNSFAGSYTSNLTLAIVSGP